MPAARELWLPKAAVTVEPRAIVTETDLECELALVQSAGAGGSAGIFGPNSVAWRVDREAAIFLGAGRALLLQLAHPWVAAAIAQHSRTLADPIGRFHRTFNVAFTIVFGSMSQALAAARRLHHRHAAIGGTLGESSGAFAAGSPYRANDVAALLWVHATLTDTALAAFELVNPPLSPADRQRYYAEARLSAALFGIPQPVMPKRWADFVGYIDQMFASDSLAVSSAARHIAAELFSGTATRWRVPLWYRGLTARLLPPRLRDEFGLAYGHAEQRSAERALRIFRRLYPGMPGRLRYVAPYHEACARLAGRERPDSLTRALNRLWIGQNSMALGRE
jgi:uncharacterized protein (DUF2236 family)